MPKLTTALSYLLLFLLSLIVLSTILGVIYVSFDWYWGWGAVVVSFILAFISTYLLHRVVGSIIPSDRTSALTALATILVSFGIYFLYSPILQIRQDPAIYLYRAMNLINYGTVYQPMDGVHELLNEGVIKPSQVTGYGNMVNGTYYNGSDRLLLDFYPGGSFVYGVLGVFDRDLSFHASTLLMTLIGGLLFCLFRLYSDPWTAFFGAILFIASPLQTWFGRAPYSEPYALLSFISLLLFLKPYSSDDLKKLSPALIALFFFGFCARIDFIALLVIGSLVMATAGLRHSIAYAVFIILGFYALKENFSVYYNRIAGAASEGVLHYGPWLIIGSSLVGSILFRYTKIDWKKVIQSKPVFYILLIFILAILVLMFRDDWTPIDAVEKQIIHGRLLRTFNEENFERLFLVFPPFAVIAGFLFIPYMIQKKNWSLASVILFLGMFIPFSIYLYSIKNSPQLYWALRRYQYILLPAITLSFIYFLNDIPAQMRRLTCSVIFLILVNQQLGARQIESEMKYLDQAAKRFTERFDESHNYLLVFDKKLKYIASTFFSYGHYEPLLIEQRETLSDILDQSDRNILYLTAEANQSDIPPASHSETFNYSYRRMGENYHQLPQDRQFKRVKFQVYVFDRNQ